LELATSHCYVSNQLLFDIDYLFGDTQTVMNIGNYQSFYNLVKDDLPVIAGPLGDCIRNVASICNCKKEQKQKKSNECNIMYINFIKQNGEALKEYFATKTSDAELLFNHDTHHYVLRLQLR